MEDIIEIAIEALKSTAIELVCVNGYEDAKQSGKLQDIRDMIEYLVNFWGLGSDLIESYDKSLEKVKYKFI